jgi:HlyD family secretion protein
MKLSRRWVVVIAVIVIAGALAPRAWQRWQHRHDGDGVVSGNGRIEAVELDVATRVPGRVREIKVAEGEFVKAGQVLAVLDADVIEAQRRQAEAQLDQARSNVATVRSQQTQRESERAAALAAVAQRKVEVDAAATQLERTKALAKQGFVSDKAVDDDQARLDASRAALAAARAQVASTEAAIASAKSQVAGAASGEIAAEAAIDRVQVDLDDTALKAPRDGRVQYIVAQPGEVVGAGARVVNMLDLTDVYMTFFLPTAEAGRLALGAEARIVLDAAPEYVIPARISFVASEAQFTPKTVETASEREKLMFRVRAQIDPELLRKHIARVKTGLPGVAYVRTEADREWPERLQVRLPP